MTDSATLAQPIDWAYEYKNQTARWVNKCAELQQSAVDYTMAGMPMTGSRRPGVKVPYGKRDNAGHGIHQPITNPKTARKLWGPGGIFEGCNVLGIMGMGLTTAVDLDCKPGRPDGRATLRSMEQEHPDEPLPRNVVSLTPTGGNHIFMGDMPAVQGTKDGIFPGIDLIKSNNLEPSHHVLLPPSVTFEHVDDRGRRTHNGEYTWISPFAEFPLPQAPDWFINECLAKRRPSNDSNVASINPNRPDWANGGGRGSEGVTGADTIAPWAINDLRTLLSFIPVEDSEAVPYDAWFKAIAAVKHQFTVVQDGALEQEAIAALDEWSSRDKQRYNQDNVLHKWNSTTRDAEPGHVVTMGTLVDLAKKHGYDARCRFIDNNSEDQIEERGKPRVILDEWQLTRSLDGIERHLAPCHKIFTRGGLLTTIAVGNEKRPTHTVRTTGVHLDEAIGQRMTIYIPKDVNGETQMVATPAGRTKASALLMGRIGQWKHLPPLLGISSLPIIRPDGTYTTNRGYDQSTGLYIGSAAPDNIQVPANPTVEDARLALEVLKEPWQYYKLSNSGLAGLVSTMIRPLVKSMVVNTPALLLTAGNSGAGKSYAGTTIVAFGTGSIKGASKFRICSNEEENSKSLLACAMESAEYILSDNLKVGDEINSPSIAEYISEGTFGGRVLGASMNSTVPSDGQLMVTGNGISVRGDLANRFLDVVIHSGPVSSIHETFPWAPYDYVIDNRRRLVEAVIILVRAYVLAASPKVAKPSRFKDWDNWVRGPMVLASEGTMDPYQCIEESMARDEEEFDMVRAMTALVALMGIDNPFGAKDVRVAWSSMTRARIMNETMANEYREHCNQLQMFVVTNTRKFSDKSQYQESDITDVHVGSVMKAFSGRVTTLMECPRQGPMGSGDARGCPLALKIVRTTDTHKKCNIYTIREA